MINKTTSPFPTVKSLITQARKMLLNVEATGLAPGGRRMGKTLGSTYTPNQTLIIEGIRFSNNGARQYLRGAKARKIATERREAENE